MGTLARSWALTKACFGILRREKYLAWFPILSGLSALLVLAPVISGAIYGVLMLIEQREASGSKELSLEWKIGGWAALLGVYFISYFIATFFNVGLISCVLNRLHGKPASLGLGIRAAMSRLRQIAGWALLGATVGVVLQAIEQRVGILGRIVTRFIGLAWSLVTFMIAPVIAFEGLGPVDAVKRSAALFKQTWGEQLAFRIGIGSALSLIFFMFAMLIVCVGVFAVMATGSSHSTAIGLWVMALAALLVIGGVLLAIVSSCLTSIYHAVLYSFAVTGRSPEDFDASLMPQRA